MTSHTIFLIGGEEDESGTLTLTDAPNRSCRLRFVYRGTAIQAEASDYFEACCDIRGKLAKQGLIPFCYGASLNVYPSGMGRDMGGGLKAYRMQEGQQASDLVYIFDTGSDVIPASVDMQKRFFTDWLASVRK